LSALILSLVESATRAPIAEQRRLQMVKALKAVLPEIDNQPDTDSVTLAAGTNAKGKPVERTFYRGRQQGALVGVAFKVIAPDGYSGNIEIMAGVDPQGTVTGIEILSSSETPGLGARISEPAFKGQFAGKSLDNADWRVKKDGGSFDQITGATISPRAVVKALKEGLEFFKQHRDAIVAAPAPAAKEQTP
jgi:electron transport complex protein RnfG